MTSLISLVASKIVASVASGLLLPLSGFITKSILGAIKHAILYVKSRQRMQQEDLFNTYLNIEEILGDFTEKYRNIAKFAPSLSRWGFFCMLLLDIARVAVVLVKLAFLKLLALGQTPMA